MEWKTKAQKKSLASEGGLNSPLEVLGISCVDCVWKRLDGLIQRIQGPLPALVKIPDGFQTAYPRVSKKNTDPSAGLATIEAIFIAAALLGNWDPTLLSEYYFGRRFIELNLKRFQELGVPVGDYPVLTPRPRNSQQRKISRGKRIASFPGVS